MRNSAELLYEGGGRGMEEVETSKLISMPRNDAEKIENVEVFERPKGTRQYETFPFGGEGATQRRFDTA
jgi:hypothetical protein